MWYVRYRSKAAVFFDAVIAADQKHVDADSDPSLHFEAYPDKTFYFDADPGPTLHFDVDPDPVPLKVMRICDHCLHGFILSLYAFIISVKVPPCLHFAPLQLLNYDFDADPHPDFTLIRIWIRMID